MKTYQETVELLAIQTAGSISGGDTGYIPNLSTFALIYGVTVQQLESDIADKYDWAYEIAMHGRK